MSSQLDAWKGEFGDAYHHRNNRLREVEKRANLWVDALTLLPRLSMDILEVGAGLGANLEAIRAMYRTIRLSPVLFALEPNSVASGRLMQEFRIVDGKAEHIGAPDGRFDLVFTYGVLIHLEDPLPAMREMYRVSRRFVMCAEYFSPSKRRIPYRDDVNLFADDYGAIWMDNFALKLVGHGFCWKRTTGLDNVTWWLFDRQEP